MTTHPAAREREAANPRRPAWIPTLAAFAAIALFVTAGNWQHRRMLEKEAMHDRIVAAAALPPVALPATPRDWREWRYRQVVARGVYDAEHQILIDNRVHAGRVGFAVVTPLRLDDGRVVLVDRGFVPGGPSRSELPSAPPPAGRVAVSGRVDLPQRSPYARDGVGAPAGPVWQHLDPARFAEATGMRVLPVVLDAVGAADPGLVGDHAIPAADSERNLSYMVQWYAFAAMAAGLWAWFTLVPVLRARHARG